MKRVLISLAALLPLSANAATSYSLSRFYGNVMAQGGGVCAAITGTFPTVVAYEYTTGKSTLTPTLVVVKILIQNPNSTPPLAPQWIVDYFTPTTPGQPGGTVTVQDPELLGGSTTLSGVSGNYTGSLLPDQSVGAYFQLSNAEIITGTAPTQCTITLNGVLYFTP